LQAGGQYTTIIRQIIYIQWYLVLEWYRFRWQIELVFKRFKQIAQLGHLPKQDPESAKAWLYGKLFVALLTDKVLAQARTLSPWGYCLQAIEAA
jgi:hypothetical protein